MLILPAALVAMAISGGGAAETVLLDFYSDSCGPCHAMMPVVEQLAAKGYPVRRVNVTQDPDLAQRLRVGSIPCFVMIVNGRDAGRLVGTTSLGGLEQLCSLGRPAAPNPNTMLAMPAAPAAPAYRGATAGNGGPNVPVVPVVYTAAPLQSPLGDATLLAASVRLRVEDPNGHSCGSGTIIDARAGGEALVLTCGHLFRDSKGTGKIEVDVFGPAPASRLRGRMVAYDLDRDIGLIAFQPLGPVMVARVAPPGYTVREGDAVASTGCNNAEDPTVQHSRVKSLDRFRDPVELRNNIPAGTSRTPWNLQVAGQPVVGRSGGGLFSADGMVIGVCNAAEPENQEGLFAAVGSIYAVLDQQRLGSLYRQAVAPPAMVPPVAGGQSALVALDPFSASRAAASPARISGQDALAAPPAVFAAAANGAASRAGAGDSGTMAKGELAVMNEIRRAASQGSEVVCIIRDRNNPQAKSEVITLDRASPAFVNQLTGVAPASNVPHETSLEVPRRPAPILEWDVETGWLHQGPLP
jgi:thiol-disulfide isomerase/thioredoxin